MNEIRKAMYDIKEGTHKKAYSRKTSRNTRKKQSKLNKRTMESLFNTISHGENKMSVLEDKVEKLDQFNKDKDK